jgi:nicotinamidase-related amidase
MVALDKTLWWRTSLCANRSDKPFTQARPGQSLNRTAPHEERLMSHRPATLSLMIAAALCAAPALAPPASATIIDEWAGVRPPPAPELKSVTVDPKTTALLVLDVVRQRCNEHDRPRCPSTVEPTRNLLGQARKAGMPVVHSLIPGAVPSDIVAELAPAKDEPVVTAGADKFLGTDLEKVLREKGVKTVIVAGTAAEGAVLSTAAESAMRGLQVVVPVDCISGGTPYAEQYTAWHLMNAPGPSGHVALTRSDMVRF